MLKSIFFWGAGICGGAWMIYAAASSYFHRKMVGSSPEYKRALFKRPGWAERELSDAGRMYHEKKFAIGAVGMFFWFWMVIFWGMFTHS
jgi:hypothetical protein